jgi:hypothetical protein
MEPPKKDNVIDFVERLKSLKEKIQTESSVFKELIEADDFDKLKLSVIHNFTEIYKHIHATHELFISLATRESKLSQVFFSHSHKDGALEIPPEAWDDPFKGLRRSPDQD